MTILIPKGPSTGKTTLLHDLIRIQSSGPVTGINTRNEITRDSVTHTIRKPDEDAQ